jgi:hypothetical protein
MSDVVVALEEEVVVNIKLPRKLVEQAKMLGQPIEERIDVLIEALEKDIKRDIAGRNALEIMALLQAIPNHQKPSMEEISDEIRAVREERKAPRS